MKEKELRNNAECSICGLGIGATGLPLFYTVKVERFGLDAVALQRLQGLTMMLGNHAALASVMGPDEDLATRLMGPVNVTVCERCSHGEQAIMAALAKAEMEGA